MSNRWVLFLVTVLVPPLLWAGEEDEPRAASVDGVVITGRQVDSLLANPATAAQPAKQSALEKIIVKELMAREAVRSGLDREPSVVAALESARRKILAQAYLSNMLRGIAKPEPAAIKAYYDEHPALFRERAVYELQEINVRASGEQLASVLRRYGEIKTLGEMADWLKANRIVHASNVALRAAESLPGDLLVSVSRMEPNRVFKVDTSFGVSIVQLISKRAEPLTLVEAKAAIESVIVNQRLGNRMREDVTRLKDSATIEYFAPYESAK